MTVVAVIQARMGSQRLPGKVLLPLAGRSLLAHVIERAAQSPGVDEVHVATTRRPHDDVVAAEAARCGATVTRGPEADVLARYAQAARETRADLVVRITADCPLLAPEVVGRAIQTLRASDADYASNTRLRHFPRGLDVEIFTAEALEHADSEAKDPDEREHVTPYIWRRPEQFQLADVCARPEEVCPDGRLTVDEPADYGLVCAVAQLLPPRDASACSLVRLLREQPWLKSMNAHVRQRDVS